MMSSPDTISIGTRKEIEAPGALGKGAYLCYRTSPDGLALDASGGVLDDSAETASHVIELNPRETGQEILGFGAAFTDAAAINFHGMRKRLRREILEAFFGKHGLGYTMGRVPMGSCDFSRESYSYAPREDDFMLKHFALSDYDKRFKIPLIKKARSMAEKSTGVDFRLFASPWSAPPWMKTNKEWVGGKLRPEPEYREAWALYYKKFFDAYHRKGVDFWGYTVINEPRATRLGTIGCTWESMNFDPGEQAAFIRNHLGPLLGKHGRYHKHLKLMIHDDLKNFLLKDLQAMLDTETGAARYVDGVTFHWYQMIFIGIWCGLTDPFCATAVAGARKWLDENGYPDVFLLPSEACEGFFGRQGPQKDANTKWYRAEQIAKDMIADLDNGASGWMDWNLVLDSRGGPNWADNFCDAPILCHHEENRIERQPIYYYMGHFTKFITRGSVHIASSSTADGFFTKPLECTAFRRPDGLIALVVLNATDKDARLRVVCGGMYINGVDIPGHSMCTFVVGHESA
jgi:glucosylceramidase